MTLDESVYDQAFKPEQRRLFARKEIPSEFANERKGLPVGYIAHLWDVENGARIARESARKMLEDEGWSSLYKWTEFDVRRAQEYDLENMYVIEAKILMEHGIDNAMANSYHRRHFSATGVIQLIEGGVPPEEVAGYVSGCLKCYPEAPVPLPNFAADHIVEMYKIGLRVSNTPVVLQFKLHVFLLTLINDKLKERQVQLLGTGREGIVILDPAENVAYKLRDDPEEEIKLFEKLADTRHVVRFINEEHVRLDTCTSSFGPEDCFHCNRTILQLEYIPGRSLEEILSSGPVSDPKKIIQYSSGILHGLLELRQAGIYHHRDIRPANIIIDEGHDRAVIIDLSIATTDKDTLAKDNRRFGSPSGRVANDLNSLGQIMYKMVTGEHLFAESKSMERTTYADALRDYRDWIYEDEAERLPPYLRMVEGRVSHPILQDIIQFCLKSHGTDEDYQRLDQRFKHVA